MLLASNPLIQVNPGLMIWTIVCFLVVLFVLKRYAFGPVQQMIDRRREHIQQAIDEADHAREEARHLLEEHKKLIGQAKTEAEEILADARRVGDAQRERVRAETEEDRQRRLEETRRQIEQATQQALGQIRDEVGEAQPRRGREDHPQEADRRRPAAPDRRGARRDRLLATRREPGHSRWRTASTRRRSSRRRRTRGRSSRCTRSCSSCATRSPAAPDLAGLLENPEVDSRLKADVLARVAQGSDEVVVNSLRLIAEKGRAAELTEIVDELDALVAAEQRVLDVEITTAIDLSEDSFAKVVAQIEDASGRSVQASRKVDPNLIGGLVLQAGSMRLDASVRGRLDRLRHDLTHARS